MPTVREFLETVARTLRDENMEQYREPLLIDAINSGFAELVMNVPEACVFEATLALDPGYEQTLPDGAEKLIRLFHNVDPASNRAKRGITPMDIAVFDRAHPHWRQDRPRAYIAHYHVDQMDNRRFTVWPPAPEPLTGTPPTRERWIDVAEPNCRQLATYRLIEPFGDVVANLPAGGTPSVRLEQSGGSLDASGTGTAQVGSLGAVTLPVVLGPGIVAPNVDKDMLLDALMVKSGLTQDTDDSLGPLVDSEGVAIQFSDPRLVEGAVLMIRLVPETVGANANFIPVVATVTNLPALPSEEGGNGTPPPDGGDDGTPPPDGGDDGTPPPDNDQSGNTKNVVLLDRTSASAVPATGSSPVAEFAPTPPIGNYDIVMRWDGGFGSYYFDSTQFDNSVMTVEESEYYNVDTGEGVLKEVVRVQVTLVPNPETDYSPYVTAFGNDANSAEGETGVDLLMTPQLNVLDQDPAFNTFTLRSEDFETDDPRLATFGKWTFAFVVWANDAGDRGQAWFVVSFDGFTANPDS